MKRIFALLVVLCCALPLGSFADHLEVRKNASVYEAPDKTSAVVKEIDLADREGPYLLLLASDTKTKGYYKVHLPGLDKHGWIYKSYVRRYKSQHPKYVGYKRTFYKHWVDEDKNCRDTRQDVLVRDATGKLTYADPKECSVAKGTWHDPYTGATFRVPLELDVDHVVPLKNAHESGAWTWSAKRRQEYANYLIYEKHLLAVSASENRKKGDKGPDRYLPPLQSYHCEYAKTWTKIKEDWELEMTDAEEEAVRRILAVCQ